MEEKARIIIAETEYENRHTVETLLRALHYEVITASNGEEASARIKEKPPSVILLDINDAGIDGFEVLRKVKEGESTRTVPVIVMSTCTEVEKRQKALGMGADDFLTKPVDEIELQTRVSSLLKVKAYNDRMLNYQQDLEKEVFRRTQEMTKSFEKIKIASLDTVYRLSRAAEYKDEDTGAHVQRMSHYTSAIARSIGLSDKFIENILWAAPMHDIGKIGIPDRILLKPGKFEDAEWAIMKTHTTIGAEILKDSDSDFIKLAGEIALTHHEKWNGSGYPNGIKGEEIPLAGRIVALADVFDALTSERPYKAPFPLEKAFAIIREGQGSHFDTKVVDAFFAVENEIIAEFNWWKFMSAGNSTDDSDLSDLFGQSSLPK
jgi:putative two-component system response regulator